MTPQDLVLTPLGVRFQGRRFPCTIGRSGVTAQKVEGDGATPRGVHRIVGMMYRPDRIPPPRPWAQPIRPGDLWSDATGDRAYNSLVRVPYTKSHEVMRRADPMYDLVILTDWNFPDATPGRGSAIFIHEWRRPGWPTAGCVAFRRDHLQWIAARIVHNTQLVIA